MLAGSRCLSTERKASRSIVVCTVCWFHLLNVIENYLKGSYPLFFLFDVYCLLPSHSVRTLGISVVRIRKTAAKLVGLYQADFTFFYHSVEINFSTSIFD